MAAAAAPTRTAHVLCGSELWSLKTLSDPQRNLVDLHPKDTTLAAINALARPHPTPKTRSTQFERQVWRIVVQITKFKAEGDSDIHLVLFDAGAYGIAEMPAAQCVPKNARARKAIIAARKKFTTRLRAANESVAGPWGGCGDQWCRLLRHPAHAEATCNELRRVTPHHRFEAVPPRLLSLTPAPGVAADSP